MSLQVDLEKKLGDFTLRVRFSAGDEVLSLFGASGCGKSLTLRCIAGMERPDRGRIVLDGTTLFDSEQRVNLPPQQRRAGLLFQSYALFPHMTVLQNVRAGAHREKNRAAREALVWEALDSFGLRALANRRPAQLSGGEQQRVALARLLVSKPQLLLLDEPFSALDSHLRFQLEQDLRRTMQRFGRTVLFVSHDRDEVYRLSDRVAVMRRGCLEALGTPQELFQSPPTKTAAMLMGCRNFSRLERLDARHVRATDWGLTLEASCPEDAAWIGLRNPAPAGGRNSAVCAVVSALENPSTYLVTLLPPGARTPLVWEVEKDVWRRHRAPTVAISLPEASLLFLTDT